MAWRDVHCGVPLVAPLLARAHLLTDGVELKREAEGVGAGWPRILWPCETRAEIAPTSHSVSI